MARKVNVEVLPSGKRGRPTYEVRPGCGVLLGMVILAWAIEIADVVFNVFGFELDALGIWPRKIFGLPGVLLSPWLHGGWAHLAGNTAAFLGLGFVMSLAEGTRFLRTTFQLVLISGLGTWLIGRGGSVHVGASGLIYGYFGYLVLRAWTERRPLWIVTGVVITLAYGGMDGLGSAPLTTRSFLGSSLVRIHWWISPRKSSRSGRTAFAWLLMENR